MRKILQTFAAQYKTVLITGGTGFLGKNLVPLLESVGVDVTATGSEYDLTKWDATQALFSLKKYDLIIHAAASHKRAWWA